MLYGWGFHRQADALLSRGGSRVCRFEKDSWAVDVELQLLAVRGREKWRVLRELSVPEAKKSQTLNPKPCPRNPKPQTLNPNRRVNADVFPQTEPNNLQNI